MKNTNHSLFDELFPSYNDQRDKAFRFIIEETLKSGFGVMNKSEMDLIIFAALIEHSVAKDQSDYEMALLLKVTPQRIRSLKEKYSVKYQKLREEDMVNEFIEMCKSAKIDEKYVDIPVYNVATKNFIENILHKEKILLHSQLNSRIFRLRTDDLILLCVALEALLKDTDSEEIKRNIITHIKNNQKNYNATMEGIDKISDFKDLMGKVKSLKIVEVISMFSNLTTIGGFILPFVG